MVLIAVILSLHLERANQSDKRACVSRRLTDWRRASFVVSWKACQSCWKRPWRKVGALPEDEQDAIASQILASLADEDAWRIRFAEKRDVIRRMAREALELEEDESGETLPLSDLHR